MAPLDANIWAKIGNGWQVRLANTGWMKSLPVVAGPCCHRADVSGINRPVGRGQRGRPGRPGGPRRLLGLGVLQVGVAGFGHE